MSCSLLRGTITELEREPRLGICYECTVKEGDSSHKQVYHCKLCKKWFCKKHREPKFPYLVDWDTIHNVQGDPEIKLLFHTQYRRKGGHPDFVYLRKTIEALEIEEKTRNELIKQAIDRMEETNRKRRLESKTVTITNIYGHRFVVPPEEYSNAEYAEYLRHAETKKNVNVIVDEYYKKYKKKHWWNKF
jgi:hypothetical protein